MKLRFASDYGMVSALLVLCLYYSWATIREQRPSGVAGARALAENIGKAYPRPGAVLILAPSGAEDSVFAEALRERLAGRGWEVREVVKGSPADARAALERLAAAGGTLDLVACHPSAVGWTVLEGLGERYPALRGVGVMVPPLHRWPNFLKTENLLNIANQIAVIAIMAIGMTLVIVAGGIDLAVGSLVALAAVLTTRLIRDWAGAEEAGWLGLMLSGLAGVAVCSGVGGLSGVAVTRFGIPPFIVTLAMMLVASGLAFLLAQGQSIYQVPEGFMGLGRGVTLGIPNAVWLMLGLYAVAHVVMERTVFGRQVYAVGGNPEAARLSGVPVRWVRTCTYVLSGSLAGLGGVIMASQLKSGAPTYGQMYELYVIAAVVVGGTSLAGGQGKVLGTLIGALIIAVIQNGMNLTGVESYTQKVVLGLVILAAVLLDRFKRKVTSRS